MVKQCGPFMSIKAGSQPYGCKFCIRSDDSKGRKILPFKIAICLVFSKDGTSGVLHNFHSKYENIMVLVKI